MFCIMKHTGYSCLVFKVKKVYMESKWFPIIFDFMIWLLIVAQLLSSETITLYSMAGYLWLFIVIESLCCFTRFIMAFCSGCSTLLPSHSDFITENYDYFKMHHWCYNSEVYYFPILELI